MTPNKEIILFIILLYTTIITSFDAVILYYLYLCSVWCPRLQHSVSPPHHHKPMINVALVLHVHACVLKEVLVLWLG